MPSRPAYPSCTRSSLVSAPSLCRVSFISARRATDILTCARSRAVANIEMAAHAGGGISLDR